MRYTKASTASSWELPRIYERQLAIAGEIGDRRSEGNALNNLGITKKKVGETRRVTGLFRGGLGDFRSDRDPQCGVSVRDDCEAGEGRRYLKETAVKS